MLLHCAVGKVLSQESSTIKILDNMIQVKVFDANFSVFIQRVLGTAGTAHVIMRHWTTTTKVQGVHSQVSLDPPLIKTSNFAEYRPKPAVRQRGGVEIQSPREVEWNENT